MNSIHFSEISFISDLWDLHRLYYFLICCVSGGHIYIEISALWWVGVYEKMSSHWDVKQELRQSQAATHWVGLLLKCEGAELKLWNHVSLPTWPQQWLGCRSQPWPALSAILLRVSHRHSPPCSALTPPDWPIHYFRHSASKQNARKCGF